MTKKLKHYSLGILCTTALLIFGQQCSNVELERYESIGFIIESKNPFQISPPTDFPIVRRYVVLVDMSNSMISGPCQNDVDDGILFSPTPVLTPFDPNKGLGNPNDHRADGIDCMVDPALAIDRANQPTENPNLNIPKFYRTFPGTDFSAVRIELLQRWFTDMINSTPLEQMAETKIMILPISGGVSQTALSNAMQSAVGLSNIVSFLALNDPKVFSVIQWLRQEHLRNYELVRSSDVWRYETTTMGTTAPATYLKNIYDVLSDDMRALNKKGLLSYADYDILYLTDGYVTPKESYLSNILSLHSACYSCASNPKNCAGYCSTLVSSMIQTWGDPEPNSPKNLDLYLGLIQSLPQLFGAGYQRLTFGHLFKERGELSRPGTATIMTQLDPLFKARNSKVSVAQINSLNPAFKLLGNNRNTVSYQLTHLFVLNPNLRLDANGTLQLDSDGDGLFDHEEVLLGTDPTLARTNGYCLDSFMGREAYAERCTAMARSRSCDPTLDSDGDSLNECEEALLGTNPFDFDTDGDGIPDFLEWIYGFNPLRSDIDKDDNADGVPNLTQFARGSGPMVDLSLVKQEYLSQYEVNFISKEKFNSNSSKDIWVESYDVLLRQIPVKEVKPVSEGKQTVLYASRVGFDPSSKEKNRIPDSESLLTHSAFSYRNRLLALMRLVDRDDPSQVFWKIYKPEVPVSSVIAQPRLDLSKFKLMRARDRAE